MSETVSITVKGMKCNGCEDKLFGSLSALNGVLSVKASHKDQQVDVEFDPDKTDLDEIEDTIYDAGFSVE